MRKTYTRQKISRRKRKYPAWVVLILLAVSFYSIVRNCKNENSGTRDGYIEKSEKGNKKEYRSLKTFTGKVVSIKDGDTFEVLYDGQAERIRLAEIDCPEKAQPYGKAAKNFASGLCYGKIVTVNSGGKRDRYGRVVGTITTQAGVNVNEALVKAGLAWHYKDYSESEALAQMEIQARAEKAGLWAGKNPVAPWDWRKNKRRKRSR